MRSDLAASVAKLQRSVESVAHPDPHAEIQPIGDRGDVNDFAVRATEAAITVTAEDAPIIGISRVTVDSRNLCPLWRRRGWAVFLSEPGEGS
jgi:hypothetical protein